jgi:HlyD family secretion protein
VESESAEIRPVDVSGPATEQLPLTAPEQGVVPAGRRRRRAPWVIAAVVVLVAASVAVAVARPFATGGTSPPGVADNADATGLYTVTRQDLSSQTEVSATLGYAGSYSVVNQIQGTVTSLPSVGQVVSQGQVLYRVSGAPVVLLDGATPAYRALSEGVTGTDVEALNADLVALGYVTSTELSPTSDEFTSWTKVGVEKLQAVLGVTQNGTLSLGQVVFEPTAVRVTSLSATLGAAAQAGETVLSATSTTRQVSIALDADQQSEVAVGDKVTITLPNNETTPGVISSVGTVASSSSASSSSDSGTGSSKSGSSTGSSSPTITVLVTPTDPAETGTWDQAPVDVTITTGSVTNALVVPVDALLAQPGGRYAVEVVGADGVHRLVAVSLGLFDDAQGLVEVTGAGLAAGQRVVVPNL